MLTHPTIPEQSAATVPRYCQAVATDLATSDKGKKEGKTVTEEMPENL